MIFFLNLTISRSIINLYGLQVSMSLKTDEVIKLGIECTNFFFQISCLQVSVLIIYGYCFQVSYARERLWKKIICINRTLDCFPKNFPKIFPNTLIWLENCNAISHAY